MPSPTIDLKTYPLVIDVPVHWGEQDAFGHVNHAVPLRWFETARVVYLERSGLGHLMTGRELAPIVISVNCNYRRQLRHPDVVQIGVRVAHMRRTSMAMHQVAFSRSSGELAVEGTTTVVFFDHLAHRPRRIPQEVRAAIEAFEGRSIPLEPPLPEKP